MANKLEKTKSTISIEGTKKVVMHKGSQDFWVQRKSRIGTAQAGPRTTGFNFKKNQPSTDSQTMQRKSFVVSTVFAQIPGQEAICV